MSLVVVRLKSFGPLHLGAERWRRVTKESWPFIPGSTLYGAVAHTLMKMTCRKGVRSITTGDCRECLDSKEARCGYALLHEEMGKAQDSSLRFSPLVTSVHESGTPYTASAYARDAAALQRGAGGILPRAPLDRGRLAIYGDRLHGLEVHPPGRVYRGFVTLHPDLLPLFRKALRWLSLFPFGGGRGKFSQVEAQVEHVFDSAGPFMDVSLPRRLKLLSPAILRGPDDLRSPNIEGVSAFRLRRYRFWRTGWYPEGGGQVLYGTADGPRKSRHMTPPRLGLPEETRLHRGEDAADAQRWFLQGFGDPDFTRYGWGQVYWDDRESEEAHDLQAVRG